MSVWGRPLIQALSALALVLAILVGWLLTGVGSQPWWPAPRVAAAEGSVSQTPELPPPTPLQQLANTWQMPLFSPSREPDRAMQLTTASFDLSGLRLTGVVIDGSVRRALFKQADGRDLSLREGGRLANGWHLQRIEALGVQLEMNGQVRRLQLPSPRLPNMQVPAPASSLLLDRPARAHPVPEGH